MTNVLIGYPDIPYHSISFEQSSAYTQPYNLVNGPKHTLGYADSPATLINFDYNLGSDFASKQATANLLYIGRADLLQSDNITDVVLYNASTFGSWTSIYSDTSFDSATLRGPRSDDYIATFNTSSARQYWRCDIAVTSSNSNMAMSKLFFGAFWDPGIEPDYALNLSTPRETNWTSDSGMDYTMKEGEPTYEMELTWRGVSDSDASDFSNNIMRYAHVNPVIIYTENYHDVLDDHRVLYCKMVDANVVKDGGIADYNTVTAKLVEMIA